VIEWLTEIIEKNFYISTLMKVGRGHQKFSKEKIIDQTTKKTLRECLSGITTMEAVLRRK